MKIKIISHIPVATEIKPKVGTIYEVTRITNNREKIYFISVNGTEVGILDHECELIK